VSEIKIVPWAKDKYQALQSNFIDGFSFRDEKEKESAALHNQQNKAPRASLQYTHNIHTRQTCRDPIYIIIPNLSADGSS
jgi:hypothetical protein